MSDSVAGSATASPWQEPEPQPLDPRSAPVPRYGTGSLADLLPAVAAGQGVPGLPALSSPSSGLALAPADRVCVFLIDGLGWELLRAHPAEAPFLTSLLPGSLNGTGAPITAGFPSTTATSLASVGTGLPPGAHGLPGYTVADPATGQLMNQLRWQPWTDPHAWQPYPTVFQ
ncbi:alkaline phosphatase family protein, partial [Streptomyces sp. MCAF7]